METNEFKFGSSTVKKIRILIHNEDNQPLSIGKVHLKGYVHELIVRFTEDASYFLVYGNNKAKRPNYDIDRFVEKVPKDLKTLELGNELKIEKDRVQPKSPLFENMTWLWVIMGLIMLVLGWFSVKMMKKNSHLP